MVRLVKTARARENTANRDLRINTSFFFMFVSSFFLIAQMWSVIHVTLMLEHFFQSKNKTSFPAASKIVAPKHQARRRRAGPVAAAAQDVRRIPSWAVA